MDELSSADVRVVLSILQGKGFEQVLQPVLLVATLNGHSLESDVTYSTLHPQYSTDLVWESDKNILRKMRSGHTPLKIECFVVKDNGIREKIGYILLSVRSAQIIPRSSCVVKKTWHKLLGVRSDLKIDKPELLLALTVRDRDATTETALPDVPTASKENGSGRTRDTVTPSLLHGECLVQLGPVDTCNDIFLLTVSSSHLEHIELLLEKYYDFHTKDSMEDNWSIRYRILENDVQLKSFRKKTGSTWILSEKVVVRIRTSLSVFKNYLSQHPYLLVYLMYKDHVIGKTEIDLHPLVPTESLQELLNSFQDGNTCLEERCFFHSLEINHRSTEVEIIRPYLDLNLNLQYIGMKMDLTIQESNNVVTDTGHATVSSFACKLNKEYQRQSLQTFQKFNEIALHRNPGGDFGKCADKLTCTLSCLNECRNVNKQSVSCETLKNQLNDVICLHSANAVLCSRNSRDYSESVEAYHCYCLHTCLVAIKFSPSKLMIRNIEFRFVHPKAETISTVHVGVPISPGEKVKLQDIGYKLHFVCSADEIRNLLQSLPPKIIICDPEDDGKTCMTQIIVDTKRLLEQNESECQYEAAIYDFEDNKIGDMDILLRLEDHGSCYERTTKISGEYLGPVIMDDGLAYRIIEELETWKERQKEMFKYELRKKEERHLNLLADEWQKRKDDLESKLACSVEQCKMLASKLNNATEDLRTRRLKSLGKEARLIKANEDLQRRYEGKLQELKESCRATHEELTSKVHILKEEKVTLEAQVEPLTLENGRLRVLVAKQSEELEVYQKASLTQDQTATLLQELKALEEKLSNVQKSKAFFKEQWGKAVREIHRMKIEYQQAVEVKIKNSKEELKNLDFEDVLCADSTALTNDQILLSQIQKEIEVVRPKSSFRRKNTCSQIFAPIDDVCPRIPQPLIDVGSCRPDEHDERLRVLIEERDSLMKTGSYTIEDSVIIKLNAEIRSLLINN